MLGMSATEVVIILALALLLLGPDQLPGLARSLGKGMRELRKATDDLKGTFESEIARIEMNEQPRMAPRPPVAPVDPAAARASARLAAVTPAEPEDPGAARAAARSAAAAAKTTEPVVPVVRLLPPEGTIARDAPAPEAAPALEKKA